MQVLSVMEKRMEEIGKKLDSLPVIEQHLTILGNQMSGMSDILLRSYKATINPEALEASRKRAEEAAKELDEAEAAELAERAGHGVGDGGDAVTEEDLHKWAEEREAG